MRILRSVLFGEFLIAVLASPAFGQTTFATLTGRVTDGAGAVVPGVTVEARHLASNYTYPTVTNEVGQYTLGQLREGAYVLRVRLTGFKEFVAQDIQLAAQDLRRIDVLLEIGAMETTVEVSAGATLIETETARISDSKDALALKVLPLNTRQLWDYLSLTPGVVQAGAGSSTRRFAGSRANQSDASIDGITVSNGTDGTQISPLVSYVESFQEFRVDMANNTAEYGGIGQVTVISKSGTNEFHGNLFDYFSAPLFRARDPFSPDPPSGVRHTPGGSIGGPVRLAELYNGRDRTFFFHSFETSRGSPSEDLLNPTVAPASWRAGDFSDLLPEVVIRDPLNNNTPFPGNRIPASRLNPVSQKIQERFFPLPNFGDTSRLVSQNYRESMTRPFDPNTYYTIRVDHRFSPDSFVFARWTWNRSHSRGFEGNLPTIGQRWQTRETRAFNVSFTRALRSNMLNEFRFGIAYNDNPRNGPLMGRQIAQELGIVGLVDDLPDINGVLNVGFSGIGLTGITQTQWRHPGFLNFVQQYQEQLSWNHARHNVKIGALLSRTGFADHQASNNLFGNVTFSNRFTGHPYADFLIGIPTTAARAFPPIRIDRTRWSYDLFVTDDFKLRPNLTLSVGLRYELHPGWAETTGQQALFDVESGKIVVPDGALSKVSPLMPRGYVDIIEASQVGLHSTQLLKNDTNNFAPRIGIAYRPWGEGTVVRAGYGIFYDIIPRTVTTGAAPFVDQRAELHQSDDGAHCDPSAGLSGVGGRSNAGDSPLSHASRPADAVFHAIQLHRRTPAMEYRLQGLVHRHQHAAGRVGLQHQPTAARYAPLHRQAAPLSQLPGDHLYRQRGRPSVQLAHARGRAPLRSRPRVPGFLCPGARYRRSGARRVGRECLRSPARTRRLARHSEAPHRRIHASTSFPLETGSGF